MQSTSSDEFRDLQTLVRQSGLLAKRPAYYGRKMLLNLVLLVIALLLIKRFHGPGLELCNAGFLAFVFAQFGFIVHDSGHQQILKAPTCNEAICLVHSNLLLGFSYSWWLNKHSRHHSAPNHIPSDPDVDLIPFAFSRDQVAQKRGLTKTLSEISAFFVFSFILARGICVES